MHFIVNYFLCPFFGLLLFLLCVLYIYLKLAFKYWEKRGVPGPKPSIPLGNIGNVIFGKQSLGEAVTGVYKYLKLKGHQHGGLYFLSAPVYMPLNHETIKNILIKDFQYFMDRGVHHDEVKEPLSAHLFSIEGEKWKNIRAKLTPTFTSGKMKMMFQTTLECTQTLQASCDEHIQSETPVDVKDLLNRYTINVIGSTAFGLDFQTLQNEDSEFRKVTKSFFQFTPLVAVQFFIGFCYRNLAKALKFRMIEEKSHDYFYNLVVDAIEYREKNKIEKNDFLQLLIRLKNKGQVEDDDSKNKEGMITLDEAAAQAFVFFLGGSDTSSTAMTFCLLELALNENIQNKLRNEVKTVLQAHNNKLTYDALNEMKFMDFVIYESLRKDPPVKMLQRNCIADYFMKDYNLTLEKDTLVFIPVHGLQMEEKYFPEPELFEPERFDRNHRLYTPNNQQFVIAFGEGPRNCIGKRFGMMQMKTGLSVLLANYSFTLNSQTKVPVKLNEKSLVTIPKYPVWLNVNKCQ